MVWKRKPSKIEVRDGLIIVYANNTGKGHIFDFDQELLDKLSSSAWNENSNGYLSGRINGKRMFAHWLVLPKHDDLEVDHINHNKWDNRKSNLRYLDRSENQFNSNRKVISSSGIRGVYWHRKGQKWQARIRKNRRDISLGLYDTIEEASEARKKAEKLYFRKVVNND